MTPKENPEQLLTIKEVMAKVRLSRSTIDRLRKEGEFPEPIYIGKRCMRWIESHVDGFIEGRKGNC